MRARFAAFLIASVAVAGCLTDETEEAAEELAFRPEVSLERVAAATEDLSNVIDPDHGGAAWLHAVPELHEGSYGMELVGYNPLTKVGAGDTAGADSGYIAMDTWKHLACIAHFAGSTGASGGATIVDISDPTDPVVTASLLSGAVNSDCQFTDDGRYLVVATYAGIANPLAPYAPPPIGDASSNGVSVYNVTDPSNPVFLFHDNLGTGAACTGCAYHNVFTAKVHGVNYIFQTYTGNVLAIKDDETGLEMVSKLDHSDHDFWVGQHPITGEWVVVTGANYGTAVFSFEDPANPTLLGVWEGDRENRFAGWHRQWPLENTVDGRAYMVVGGEECNNGHSLPYQVLDWTDPIDMQMTGTWWIPGKPANPDYAEPHLCEMNSHEFEVWDGYVATGNYHAGIWLFDVGSPERAYEPATLGYYLPSEIPQAHGGTVNAPFVWSPNVWGAYFDERGYILAADWSSGLYILSFGGTRGE